MVGVKMGSGEINGVINVLKPPGMTSHDVVGYLRRTLKTKKAGHTGTLDPGVAGVLPVCLGKATKTIEYMGDDVKEYRAEVTFGRTTDTQDGFGQTIAEQEASSLTRGLAEDSILALRGRISQIPPMVSALKHQGRKLYELARQGIVVERQPRSIDIFDVKIIRSSGFGTANPAVLFDVRCSKGTYVRTICHDLGEMLGFGGFMSFLVRTGTGRFNIREALTLEEIAEIAQQGIVEDFLLSVSDALPLNPVWIYDGAVKSVLHGNRVYHAGIEEMPIEPAAGTLVKLLNKNAGCLAVAKVIIENLEEQGATAGIKIEETGKRFTFQPVKVFAEGS